MYGYPLSGAEVVEGEDVGDCGSRRRRGAVRVKQYPAGRGGGVDHPYSGVGVGVRYSAALRGVLGVGPNSDVGGAMIEF